MELTEGIVIKVYDKGENSQTLKIITREGIITAIAKGSKLLAGKTRLYASPFTCFNFGLSRTYITSFEVLDYHYNLKEDKDKMISGLKILEICNILGEHITSYPVFYSFLKNILSLIDRESEFKIWDLIFRIKVLYLLGISPVFNQCVSCGNKTDLIGFSFYDGGMKCGKCHTADDYIWDKKTVDVIKKLYFLKIKEGLNISGTVDYQATERFIHAYYEYYLGFKSKIGF